MDFHSRIQPSLCRCARANTIRLRPENKTPFLTHALRINVQLHTHIPLPKMVDPENQINIEIGLVGMLQMHSSHLYTVLATNFQYRVQQQNTYTHILRPTHKKRSITLPRSRLDFDVIRGMRSSPFLVQVPGIHQDGSHRGAGIGVDYIGCFDAVPGAHILVVWMNGDMFSDCTLPVGPGEIWEVFS